MSRRIAAGLIRESKGCVTKLRGDQRRCDSTGICGTEGFMFFRLEEGGRNAGGGKTGW